MSEAPKERKNDSDPELIFSEIKHNAIIVYRDLFKKTTSYYSLPEFIKDWAADKGFDEEIGWKRINQIKFEDLNEEQKEQILLEKEKLEKERNDFLSRVYARTSAVIKYANQIVGADTDYYTDPIDREFHKDLVDKSAEIESNWDQRTNEDWRKKIKEDIDHRVFEYTKAKPNS